MSQYHANCTKEGCVNKPKLTRKPFCDCKQCLCRECPDILKHLRITVTDTSCTFDCKVAEPPPSEHDFDSHHSLLDVLSKSRDCNCALVARAVKSDLHMNIGMSESRNLTNCNMLRSSAIELQSATSSRSTIKK